MHSLRRLGAYLKVSNAVLFNVSLRGVSLFLRFAFILYLAKFTTPEVVASFGLISVLVGYGVLLVGFEFHTYSNREYVSLPELEKYKYFKTTGLFYLFSYLAIIPFALLIFFLEVIPWKYFFVCALLLISEHISQEISRFLIFKSKQVCSTFLIFLKTGCWCLFVFCCFFFLDPNDILSFILYSWLLFSFIACAVGGYLIRDVVTKSVAYNVDYSFLKSGIFLVFYMFLVSATIQAYFAFDRLLIQSFSTPDVLAAYTLYAASSFTLLTFLDSGIISFYMVHIINAVKDEDVRRLREIYQRLARSVALFSLIFSMALYVCLWLAVRYFLPNSVYEFHLSLLKWTVFCAFLLGIGTIPHTMLYAFKKDSVLMRIQVFSLFLFFILVFLWCDDGVFSVLIPLVISLSVMTALKLIFIFRLDLLANKV